MSESPLTQFSLGHLTETFRKEHKNYCLQFIEGKRSHLLRGIIKGIFYRIAVPLIYLDWLIRTDSPLVQRKEKKQEKATLWSFRIKVSMKISMNIYFRVKPSPKVQLFHSFSLTRRKPCCFFYTAACKLFRLYSHHYHGRGKLGLIGQRRPL